MRLWGVLLLVGSPVAPYGQKDPEEPPRNFQSLYEEGREAYLENRFPDCVKLFEAALRDYKLYTRVVVDCKAKCKKSEAAGPTLHDQDMLHYQRLIEETLCNMKCKLRALPRGRPETVKEDIRTFFEERKPYDFLQLCYYQTGRHQAAASAAYTNLAVNPEAETMQENLAYYLALPGVARAEVVDLEAKAWVGPYLAGRAHYAEEEWGPMVEAMEESLKLYLREEEECRLACDKPFDQKWYPDFTSSVANHFTFCLKCRRNCPEHLNNLNGEYTDDLVATFYHHLQFGYYHLGQAGQAAAAARSFLLLLPDHGDMQGNLAYYRQEPGGGEAALRPREETVAYLRRQEDEEKLLDYITTRFVFPEEGLLEEEAVASVLEAAPEVEEEPLKAKLSAAGGRYMIEDGEDAWLPPLMPPPVVKFEL